MQSCASKLYYYCALLGAKAYHVQKVQKMSLSTNAITYLQQYGYLIEFL